MGRQPLAPRPPDRPRRDATPRRSALFAPARRAHRPATGPPAGSRSPTSRSSRSPRRSRSTPACSIMDEPTAALSGVEVDRLFAVARSLRDEGRALLFISHRFDEVFALCDTVTVMRDGAYVSTDRHRRDHRRRRSSRGWSAARSATCSPRPPPRSASVVLEVESLTRAGVFHDVSFEVRAGEIVGLAGLVGAGRSEIARAVFGVDRYDAGPVTAVRPRRRRARPARRDPRRHRVRPRGPPQAGPGHRELGAPATSPASIRGGCARSGSSPRRRERAAAAPGPAGSR